jgi:hypothetical protein
MNPALQRSTIAKEKISIRIIYNAKLDRRRYLQGWVVVECQPRAKVVRKAYIPVVLKGPSRRSGWGSLERQLAWLWAAHGLLMQPGSSK